MIQEVREARAPVAPRARGLDLNREKVVLKMRAPGQSRRHPSMQLRRYDRQQGAMSLWRRQLKWIPKMRGVPAQSALESPDHARDCVWAADDESDSVQLC